MPKDDYLDMSTEDFGVPAPSTKPEKLFEDIVTPEIKVVKSPEMKDTPEPTVHYHNDLDQPSIDINTDITGVLAHSALSGVTADQHHAQSHVSSHASGGGDDLSGKTLANMTLNSGTLISPVIGTMNATGGTATNLTAVTPTIGTPSLTGGTLNPTAYQAGGTVGVDGTAIYVKTIVGGAADTWGTITFTKGIATSVS